MDPVQPGRSAEETSILSLLEGRHCLVKHGQVFSGIPSSNVRSYCYFKSRGRLFPSVDEILISYVTSQDIWEGSPTFISQPLGDQPDIPAERSLLELGGDILHCCSGDSFSIQMWVFVYWPCLKAEIVPSPEHFLDPSSCFGEINTAKVRASSMTLDLANSSQRQLFTEVAQSSLVPGELESGLEQLVNSLFPSVRVRCG